MARKSESAEKIDKIIGAKIYKLRISAGYSREQLARKIGVTHQQLQKYEKAINRISAGRLVYIARALGVSVSFLFEDIDAEIEVENNPLRSRICIELIRNFTLLRPSFQESVSVHIKNLVEC